MPDGPDWSAIRAEALEALTAYIRIDTSNPPGNEKPAARLLGRFLEADGITPEFIEIAPEREAVVARLEGDGSERALMLGNHTDVVPVEAEYWDVPPFSGTVQDGRVYGRGAIDMKSVGIMQLFAMLIARRQGLRLRRDLLFVAVPDEEVGSAEGMAWMIEHRPDVFEGVAFALNEGGSGFADFGGRDARLFQIAVTEKEMCPLRLTVIGTPGHGSRPHADNSTVHLAEAIVRLARWDRPLRFGPGSAELFARLHAGGLIASPDDTEAVERALRASPDTQATYQDTLNVTLFNAGIKSNVIPARSEATIDCRLAPGQTPEQWRREVERYIDDPRIAVEFRSGQAAADRPAVSDWDTDLAAVIEQVIREAYEDAVVVPSVSTVGTDNRFVRRLGIPSYGFIPCLLSQAERDGFHANNEFMTLENFETGLEIMYEVVARACT